jgi:purine-cytosine permease-like protein
MIIVIICHFFVIKRRNKLAAKMTSGASPMFKNKDTIITIAGEINLGFKH